MAVISIDHQHAWVVARWAVGYVLDRVNLAEVSEVLSRQIAEAVEHDSGYLSLEELTPKDRAMFGAQVKRIADNLVQAGPSSLATPSIHDSLVKSIRELERLIEESVIS